MTYGSPADFAIEAYHEPSGPEWGGIGRMAIDIQGIRLGDIRENHCSLFHAVDRFRELSHTVETLWDDSFSEVSDFDIFNLINDAIYISGTPDSEKFYRFDFLTNTGEQFDCCKTFILCRPKGRVHILYQLRDDSIGSASCPVETFRRVSTAFVNWFDEQARTTAPPYFNVEPTILELTTTGLITRG